MNNFIKDLYNRNIMLLEQEIEKLKNDTATQISLEKERQSREIIAPKFSQIDEQYNLLAVTIKKEMENKLQDAKNSADQSKKTYQDFIYSQIEQEINDKTNKSISELENLINEYKNKLS